MSGKSLSALEGFVRNQTPYLQGSMVHADTKANFLIALIGVFLAYLETRQPLVTRVEILFGHRGWESVSAGLALLAAALLIIGGCLSVFVVYPRFSPNAARETSSFVEISRAHLTSHDFADTMLKRDDADVILQQLRAHHYRCQVCARKWRILAFAYASSASGMIAFALHFIIVVLQTQKVLS